MNKQEKEVNVVVVVVQANQTKAFSRKANLLLLLSLVVIESNWFNLFREKKAKEVEWAKSVVSKQLTWAAVAFQQTHIIIDPLCFSF